VHFSSRLSHLSPRFPLCNLVLLPHRLIQSLQFPLFEINFGVVFSVLTFIVVPLNLYNCISVVLPYVVNCVALQLCVLAFSETQVAGLFLSTHSSFMRPLGPIIFSTFASINVSISKDKMELMRSVRFACHSYCLSICLCAGLLQE